MGVVQVAGLIALVGSLLAVGVPTFMRTVRRSKIAEATAELSRLHQRTTAYYLAEHADTPDARYCVPPSAGPTPDKPSADPMEVDFSAVDAPGRTTWVALAYQPEGPIRFRYTFIARDAGCLPRASGVLAVLRAEGDLDDDGDYSLLERRFTVDRDHQVMQGDVLMIHNRVE